MEESKPLFSAAALRRLLIPSVLEQLLVVTVGVADTVMVSSVGEAAVSALSLVDAVNIMLFQLFVALCTGGAVVISQYLGRKDLHSARRASGQLVYFIMAVTLAVTALILLFVRPLLKVMFGRVEPDVMSNALVYFRLTALSYPFFSLFTAGSVIYRCLGNSKVSLYISLFMNLFNISGNALLIYGFGMGVAGAATATLVSRILGAGIMVFLIQRKSCSLHIDRIWRVRFRWKYIQKILHISLPNGAEVGLFQAGKLVVQSLISTFGTSAIAANAIVNAAAGFLYAPGLSFGLGLVTVVGRCMGAGEVRQAERYTKRIVGVTFLVLGGLNLALFLGSNGIASLFQVGEAAQKTAAELLRWFALGNGLLWTLAFTTPNALRASGDVKFTMFIALLSMTLFRIGAGYLLGVGFGMGVYGVWLAMYVDWFFRAVVFTRRFYKGKWKTFKAI